MSVRPSVRPSVVPSRSIKEKRGLGASYVGYPALLLENNIRLSNIKRFGIPLWNASKGEQLSFYPHLPRSCFTRRGVGNLTVAIMATKMRSSDICDEDVTVRFKLDRLID